MAAALEDRLLEFESAAVTEITGTTDGTVVVDGDVISDDNCTDGEEEEEEEGGVDIFEVVSLMMITMERTQRVD